MIGSVLISHNSGWACSNDVTFNVERDIITADSGEKVSKRTNTLKIKGLFDVIGKICINLSVDCVFKTDDTDKVQGFTGTITAQTKETTLIVIHSKTERTKEIIKKIKEDK